MTHGGTVLRGVTPEPGRRTVLVVASNTTISGGETFLLRLARHAPSFRPPSTVVTLGFGNGGLDKALEALGVRLWSLQAPPLSSIAGTFAIARRIAAQASAIGADIILANGTHPFVYAALASRTAGVPVGQWLHDVPPQKGRAAPLEEHVVHWMRSDALMLCNSSFTARIASELTPPGALLPITPPGQELVDRDESAARGLRERLGLRPHGVVVGFAGRLGALKGVTHLAAAFEKLGHLAASVEVLLAGGANLGREAELGDEVAARIVRAGFHVVRTGHVSPLLPYLQAMDVLVAPSVFEETFGLSVMEAMACGVPVIASNIGALPELVVAGETGWLCEPGNEAELAQAIERAATDAPMTQRLGLQARERVRRRYSVDVMVRTFEAAIARAARF